MSCDMWFGTKDYAQFIRTPQTGADVSPSAWGVSGTFLNGAGYALNSFNSHKEYQFSWGSSAAREAAQTMKSYFDGSFGRGKLHFVDPLTYSTNVLPARWADPSITANFEGPRLVPGVDPYTVPTSNFQRLRLPVRTTVFDLDSVQPVANTVFLPEAENLFTNPNLVGDGTWAEVRRNYVANPDFETGVDNWTTEAGIGSITRSSNSWGVATGSYCMQVIGAESGLTLINTAVHARTTGGVRMVVPSGREYVGVAFSARRAVATPLAVQVVCYWYTEAGVYKGATSSPDIHTISATRNDMTSNRYVHSVAPLSDMTDVTRVMPIIRFRDADGVSVAPAGFQAHIDAVHIDFGVDHDAAHMSVRDYFDGSTTPATAGDVIQPEDFRWRWLGEPNESESVMEIERVAGLAGVYAIAGVSTWEGKPAVRLIPIRDGYVGSCRLNLSHPELTSGTAVGTINYPYDREVTGAYRNQIRALFPTLDTVISDPAPNEAGSYPVRLTWSESEPANQVRWYNGGTHGSGDVWWTDIGLYEGDYTGPWFSGDTEIPGKVTRWTGTPNNSTSQIGVLQPVSTPNINEENSVFVPIPDGMQLNVGAFYSGSPEAGVYVVNATQGGSPGMNITRLQPLTPSDTNILPDVFTKAPGDIGVYIIFGKLDSVDALLNVTAIHARLSPIGVNPQGENYWLGGQGNEGVRFVQPPTYINHTGVNGGQVEFAATFKESVL